MQQLLKSRVLPAQWWQRCLATLIMVSSFITIGIVVGGWWTPFIGTKLFTAVSYGLPQFENGRWWTVLTGSVVANDPLNYVLTTLSFIGVGVVEWKLGSRAAIAIFSIGQVATVLATAAILWCAQSVTGWSWAQQTAHTLDTGPSGGTIACIAVAAGLFTPPWRVRAWLVLIAALIVPAMFWGSLADLEHLVAVTGVLLIIRPFQVRRVSIDEQRLIASIAVLVLAVLDLIYTVVPSDGPFGVTRPIWSAPWLSVINIVIGLALARGLFLGRRWAWLAAMAAAAGNIALGLVNAVRLITTSTMTLSMTVLGNLGDALLWIVALIMLIDMRHAYRGTRALDHVGDNLTRDDVRHVIAQYGGNSMSWMATWRGMQHALFPTGLITYQLHNKVAIVLGTAYGPVSDQATANRAFISAAEHAGVTPCFFNVSEPERETLPNDWKSIYIGDDMIVPLDNLAFTGKRWGDVRTALNRAKREQISVAFTRWNSTSINVRSQLINISESWIASHELPEMGFTLGTLTEAKDHHVRLAIATSSHGRVEGFLSWLPIYESNRQIVGWTLDLMRRRTDSFPTVVELLIGSSIRQFADEGYKIASLSGAPLVHDSATYKNDTEQKNLSALIDRAADALEPVYGFRSLQRFKRKFNPTPHRTYLIYRSNSDLPRILIAIVRAYLPRATLRDFAAAGADLLRNRNRSTST